MEIIMILESIGVDSLVSIEIRNWCRWELGLTIPVLEIMNTGASEGLGKAAISSLEAKYGIRRDRKGEMIDDAGAVVVDGDAAKRMRYGWGPVNSICFNH